MPSRSGPRPTGWALVAFAGTPHLLCPLTVDASALRIFLELLETGLAPRRGTDVGAAIRKGLELLEGSPGKGVLLLLSDGESLSGDPMAAAREAAEAGVRIYALGVGTPAGEPVPLRDPETGEPAGFQKDPQGRVVTSRLDERTLTALATETGGRYLPLAAGAVALDALREDLEALPTSELEAQGRVVRPERYQLPLAVAVLALALELALAALAPMRERRAARRTGAAS